MTAHNTVLNRPCHAHPYLVNKVFREEYGFGDGVIISDCNDIPALVDFRVAKVLCTVCQLLQIPSRYPCLY
jgi:beta-glucosidase-like glycosyl hydrolase